MLAFLEKVEDVHIARFDRPLEHLVEEVWAAMTQNDLLNKWMQNLQVVDLRRDGTIKFNMNDGTGNSFDIKIKDCKVNEILEFEWGDGRVRFELSPKPEGCLLILKEFIGTINDHTSKDLAGWHVCLNLLNDVLNGHVHEEFPKEIWEKWHQKYEVLTAELKRKP